MLIKLILYILNLLNILKWLLFEEFITTLTICVWSFSVQKVVVFEYKPFSENTKHKQLGYKIYKNILYQFPS